MKAMILAAGRGERMRPLTDATPKPLLEAGGKALIVWLIEALARARFMELVVNVSHLGERIESALGDGQRWGVRIQYSREREALETAGGIAKALPLLGMAPFLVVNADIHTDFDFSSLAQALPASGACVGHLVLVDNPAHHPDGDFALHGRRVAHEGAERLTFSGIGVYRPALFSSVEPGSRCPLAVLLTPQIRAGHITGERYAGHWADVGTPQRLSTLDRALRL